MSCRRLVFVALLLFFGGFGSASADEIGDLRTELQQRRDNDYPAPLDRADRRELRAIVRALDLLDRPATSLVARARTLTTLARGIARAFPAEFSAPTETSTSLRVLLDAIAESVRTQAETDYEQLAEDVPVLLNVPRHRRAERSRAAARRELDLAAAAATPDRALGLLARAARFIDRGLAFAATDSEIERFAVSFNGLPRFRAEDLHVEITVLPGEYLIDASGSTSRPGRFTQVRWTSSEYEPVTGPGVYRGWGSVRSGDDADTITDPYSGFVTMEILRLDTTTNTFRARFTWGLYRDDAAYELSPLDVNDGVIATTEAIVR